MWKQDAVKFKWTMCAVFRVVFENVFMQMNSITQSLLKSEYHSAWISRIFVFRDNLFIVCEYKFSPKL